MNRYVYSVRSDFKKLSDGIRVYVPSNDVTLNVRGILTGTCDTPARCECLNFVNFNGTHGCSFCLCESESVLLNTQGHRVQAFPYRNDIVLRTSKNTETFAYTATEDNPVMGVKGHSAFSKLMPDFIQGMALDRMHGVEVS